MGIINASLMGTVGQLNGSTSMVSQSHISPKGDTAVSKDDTISLSEQAKLASEKAAQQKAKAAEAEKDAYTEQMESAQLQAKAMSDNAKTQGKCITIASRIMAGDEVPKDDYQYLAKNNSELYAKAITLRVSRQDPKKHKRLSEDEKVEGSAEAGAVSGGSDAPAEEVTPVESDGSAPTPEGAPAAGSAPEHIDIRA